MSLRAGSTPFFGHHRMHLGFEPGAQLHELRPVADQLAQLAYRWRCDPRLRQSTESQQVRKITGAFAFIVLDPTVPPIVARRVRKMHAEASVLEQIHRPVPTVGSFDHYLRVRTRLGDLLEQHRRIIRELRTHSSRSPSQSIV